MQGQGVVNHHAEQASLRHYLQIARRRKWLILQALVLVPLLAAAYSLHQQRLYRASAKVLLTTQNLSNALTDTQATGVQVQAGYLAETQAEVGRVTVVAQRTLDALHLKRSVDIFRARSSVSADPNADILTFSVVDPHPALAVRQATEYAEQYIAYAGELATGALQQARNGVDKRIGQLVRAKKTTGTLYSDLVARDQQLATMEALQGSPASLIQGADRAAQVQPRTTRNGILGLLLGLVLGCGLALLRESLDTRVRTAEEISGELGLPLLGRLPEPPRRLRADGQLAMLEEPHGVASESFRMLRTNLEFVRLEHDVRTIMVTSAVTQEGKSTTAGNLAVALARAGQKVALVDLDLRRPAIDGFFGVDSPGLTLVAIGQATLDQALLHVPFEAATLPAVEPSSTTNGSGNGNGHAKSNGNPRDATLRALSRPGAGNLDVLASGPTPPNVGEFVGSEALAAILRELRNRYDTVIIDSPPALQVGDAGAMAALVDSVVVVARMNLVRRTMLRELKRQLDAWPARKLGFVVANAQEEEGYGYGDGYIYRYGYDASAATAPQPQLPVSS